MYSPNEDAPVAPRTPYQDGAGSPLQAPKLLGNEHGPVDIVIIGGGITGVSLALHATEAGARVALLEAREIGWGASGRNSGHVPPATKLEPAELLRRYGPERGMRLIDAVASGPDLVFGITEKYRIQAEAVRSGVITAACTPKSLETLRKRTEFWQARGAGLKFFDRAGSAALIGTDRYLGSSVDPRGGTINPLAYVRGMARAAAAMGACIYEQSVVTAYKRQGSGWHVTTSEGSIKADMVAICANAYSGQLSPELRSSIVPVRAYQFMTDPLPEGIRRSILPGGQGLTDTRRLMSGIRVHSSGGLFFSGLGAPFGSRMEPYLGYSLGRIRRLFPQLSDVKLSYWWTGWMAMNSENAWKIHELAPGLVTALGCNGRGLAIATILGRELAQFFRGKAASDLILPFAPIRRVPLFELHPPLVTALVAYYRVRDAIDDRMY